MSRKEASNTFTDGLIKDLNPINTPNTVLTDCLNGTLITYDGNEYSLQNDRGNYALKYCKLKPNYIPVGIKEYGDILYIVSYNPLDEHVEIGSYPSPETVHDASDLDDLEQEVFSTLEGVENEINYSAIVESKQPLYVFYGASENGPEEYKLNPGDLYKISIAASQENDSLSDLSIYERLRYYVFDEDRKSYDITDKITVDAEDFTHVNWDIPGWIAIQPKFAEITDFNVNVKKLIVPSYGNAKVKLTLNFQLSTEDLLYINNLISASDDLKVRFKITAEGSGSHPDFDSDYIELSLSNTINTKNGSIIFYSNDWSNLNLVATEYSSLTITAVPFVVAKTGIRVYYDRFEKSMTFNLNQKGTTSDFNIGSNHWWYNTNLSNRTFSLTFDTKGLTNSSVLDQDVYLFYSIKRIDGSYVTKSDGSRYKDILCDGWSMIGETNLEFQLTEFTTENYTSYPTRFYAEDFYVMEFDFYDTYDLTGEPEPLRTGISKFITASELMNDQKVALFDTVSFDTWIKKYKDSIKNKKVSLTKENEGTVVLGNPYIKNQDIFSNWENGSPKLKYGNELDYTTLVSNDSYEDLEMENGFSITCDATCSTNIKYGTSAKLLVGPIWTYLNSHSNAVFESKGFNSGQKPFSAYTGELVGNDTHTATIKGSASKIIPYKLSAISPSVRIWVHHFDEMKYTELSTISSADFDGKDSWFLEPQGWWSLNVKGISSVGVDGFSSGKKFMYVDNIRTIEYSDEHLSKMANKFSSNDIYLLKLEVGLLSNAGNDVGYMYLRSGSKTFISTHGKTSGQSYYFAAVRRTSNSIALLPIIYNGQEGDAKLIFTTWLNKIHKLVGDPTTIREGCFYEAIEGAETVSNNVSLFLDGKIIFGGLKYTSGNTEYNLFSAYDRSRLLLSFDNLDKSNLLKINSEDVTNIDSCELERVEEVSNAPVDFSPQTASINVLKARIEGVNTKSNTQLGAFSEDTILQSEEPNTTKYFEKTPGAVGSVFLDLLNNRTFVGHTPLYYEMHRTTFSYTGGIRKCIAYVSTSDQYNIT